MAELEVDGLAELVRQLESADLYSDECAGKMLRDMAEDFESNVGKNMRSTRYDIAHMIKEVGHKKKIKTDKDGSKYVTVSIKGKNNHGERNATIVFVLNYGRQKEFGYIPPGHFWDAAAQQTSNNAQKIAENAANDYLKKKGLI